MCSCGTCRSSTASRVEDMVIVGHSVGAVTVAAWVHDYAPPVRAMVLVTPALKVKLYVPFARTGLALLQAMRGEQEVVRAELRQADDAHA